MPTWLEVAGTLGVAVLGGIVAPYVTNSRDRRATRAKLFEVISVVGEQRWNEIDHYASFNRSVTTLQSTALIARVPRWAVDDYVQAAFEARRGIRSLGHDENGPILTGDAELEAGVRQALDSLTYVIWHPKLGRLRHHVSRDRRPS